MQIYEFEDYKSYLQDLMHSFPKNGRGQARRLAEALNVNSVVVSQVLAGDRHFTSEQALTAAAHFALDTKSTDYLLLLVQRARAADTHLSGYLGEKLAALKREAQDLKHRMITHRELSDRDKGVFYSNWYYSGIRLLTSLPGYNRVDEIARYFGLEPVLVAKVLEYLIAKGLCERDGERVNFGVTATYVDRKSPYVDNHRRNWRLKGLQRLTAHEESDVFYSGPFSLSKADAEAIRKRLVKMIGELSKTVADSPPESLHCLNIDWFGF
jgi:uncharacterized protein (TIGR02147 family)